MTEVWVTGLGFITSIGCHSGVMYWIALINLRHGIALPTYAPVPESPVKVAGTIDEFELGFIRIPRTGNFPVNIKYPGLCLRSFSPHVLYAWCSLATGD